MSEAANSSIPLEVRQQFPCDDHGRILWFTTPPLNTTTGPAEVVSAKDGKPLAHTPEYLAAKEKRKRLIEERKEVQKRTVAEKRDADAEGSGSGDQSQIKRKKVTDEKVDALVLQKLTDQILTAHKEWYTSQYGERAAEMEAFDAERAAERKKQADYQKAYFEERMHKEVQRRERERAMAGKVFKDDWDERY